MAIELNNKHVSYGFIAAIMGDNLAFQKAITDAITAKVDTLVGEDASKSVRAIALEELTKQLIPENADEAMNTLQEIAAWLQAHPTEAAAFNVAINKLNGIVAGIGGEGEKATVVAYVTDAIAAAQSDITAELAKKVDKVEGSRLMTDDEGDRLAAMSDGANKTEVAVETITAGTKVATIIIDDVSTDIKVPTVVVTAEATSGVKVGSIKVGDDDAVNLYISNDEFATVDEAHALFTELTTPKAAQ